MTGRKIMNKIAFTTRSTAPVALSGGNGRGFGLIDPKVVKRPASNKTPPISVKMLPVSHSFGSYPNLSTLTECTFSHKHQCKADKVPWSSKTDYGDDGVVATSSRRPGRILVIERLIKNDGTVQRASEAVVTRWNVRKTKSKQDK